MPLPLLRCFSSTRQIYKNFSEFDQTLKDLCFSGSFSKAVQLLCCNGSQINPQTYAFLLQESINLKNLNLGRRIHAQMIRVGFMPDEYLQTKLIILYAKNGDLETAQQLFDRILHRNLVSWNAMISGYVQMGLEDQGLNIYYSMRRASLRPDQFTFASVFRACASLAMLEQGRRVHGIMIKIQVMDNVVVNSALVDMYFKCSSPHDGHRAFHESLQKNVVMWTALISGYGQHGWVGEVFLFFDRMVGEGFRPNYVTFIAVLSACSHAGLIDEGWRYFNLMTRDYGITPRAEHYAAMVDLLGRSGRLVEAYKFVQSSPSTDHSVTWGALLGACRMHGDLELARLTARRLFELDPENAGKYVVLSNAYAGFGLWEDVRQVREIMRTTGMRKDPAWSWIEVRGEVHTFLVGDKSHEKTGQIFETIKELTCILKEAGYVSDLKSLG